MEGLLLFFWVGFITLFLIYFGDKAQKLKESGDERKRAIGRVYWITLYVCFALLLIRYCSN